MTMDATDLIAITLEARQWNVLIEALVDAPYRVAAPLINAIATQAKAAEMAAAPPAPFNRAAWGDDAAPERANGQAPPEAPAPA
jgi:hypothetical protein